MAFSSRPPTTHGAATIADRERWRGLVCGSTTDGMDFLREVTARGASAWNDLGLLQQFIVGAVGAVVSYLILGSIMRSMWRITEHGRADDRLF